MKDAPVVVFDEPTANLDLDTEAALLTEIEATAAEKVCILISHRMFRPGIADHIVVLSQGEVVEQGTYDQLVAADGEFARLRELYYQCAEASQPSGEVPSPATHSL
jgi:ABC-type transport system involved in cytochrome bd biosynthesis fused ATPase/permease subunit